MSRPATNGNGPDLCINRLLSIHPPNDLGFGLDFVLGLGLGLGLSLGLSFICAYALPSFFSLINASLCFDPCLIPNSLACSLSSCAT